MSEAELASQDSCCRRAGGGGGGRRRTDPTWEWRRTTSLIRCQGWRILSKPM